MSMGAVNSAFLRNVALYRRRLLISRTQSSSFPGPSPPPCASKAGSDIEDRLMQGMRCNYARTVTDSAGIQDIGGLSIHGNTCGCTAAITYLRVVINQVDGKAVPSTTLTRRLMEDDAGKTSGRKERFRGRIGVRTRALSAQRWMDDWT